MVSSRIECKAHPALMSNVHEARVCIYTTAGSVTERDATTSLCAVGLVAYQPLQLLTLCQGKQVLCMSQETAIAAAATQAAPVSRLLAFVRVEVLGSK